MERTISARWIAPVVAPPIADGVVSFVDGGITYVGPADGRPIDERFDNAILLPGFVNAHTHLDLTGASGKTPPRLPFPDWLRDVIAYRRTRNEEQTRADIAVGIRQSLAAGVTLVGDIAAGGLSWQTIADSPLRAVVYFELLGLTVERARAALSEFTAWRAAHYDSAQLRRGVSPHSPYGFRTEALDWIVDDEVPLATHVNESLDEQMLAIEPGASFERFLQELGVWDATAFTDEWQLQRHARFKHLLLVHSNWLPVGSPIPHGATVVYCPRTHAAFGHAAVHPFQHLLLRGDRVVLGTDSLASNPDLSVLNEARFVMRQYPDFAPPTLLKMITHWPAEALTFSECGSLRPGNHADLTVVTLPPDARDPLAALFNEESPVRATFIAGTRVA